MSPQCLSHSCQLCFRIGFPCFISEKSNQTAGILAGVSSAGVRASCLLSPLVQVHRLSAASSVLTTCLSHATGRHVVVGQASPHQDCVSGQFFSLLSYHTINGIVSFLLWCLDSIPLGLLCPWAFLLGSKQACVSAGKNFWINGIALQAINWPCCCC